MPEVEVERLSKSIALWRYGTSEFKGQIRPTAALGKWAESHGLEVESLLGAAMTQPEVDDPPPVTPTEPLVVRVRGVTQPASESREALGGTPKERFAAALALPVEDESVIYWGKATAGQLCVLDVDYKHPNRPEPQAALSLLARLRPIPAFTWVSHFGGLRAVFTEFGAFRADELAACAAVSAKALTPQCTVEIGTTTLHPGAPRVVKGAALRASAPTPRLQSLDGALSQWRGGADETVDSAAVDEWLDDRGMVLGGRYPHSYCPFDASDSSSNDPVMPNEDGVVCWSCRPRGHSSGGFAAWGRLLNGHPVSRILEAAQALVPFEHARFVVFEDYGSRFGSHIARLAYQCLAKLSHEEGDPRVARLTQEFRAVRSASNLWVDSETLVPISPPPKDDRLSLMPSARRAWKNAQGLWEDKPDGTLLDLHRSNQPIRGFPGVIPVRGVRIWGQYLAYAERNRFVRAVVTDGTPEAAAYIPAARRLSLAECEAALERDFPGINLDYLKLIIVARGYAESGVGMVPLLLVLGPTGAGKTQTIHLAGQILGDPALVVPEGNYQETLGYTSAKSGLVILDEFAKSYPESKIRKAFDFLLQVNREFAYRHLYVGPVTARVTSAIFICNNAYGNEVMEHQQFGRRSVYVTLVRRSDADWQVTSGGIETWRSRGNNGLIGNSLLSHLVDEFFVYPEGAQPDTFHAAAEKLGFFSLTSSRERLTFEGLQNSDLIKDFFAALNECDDPGDKIDKFKGKGWRVINLDESESRPVALWRELCDDWNDPKGRGTSMKVAEQDLAKVLGVPTKHNYETVRFFALLHGRKLFAKFQHQYGRGRTEYRTGPEIERNENGI